MDVNYVKLTDEQAKCIVCGKPINYGRAYVKLLTDHSPKMRCVNGHKKCREKVRERGLLKNELKKMIREKLTGS